MYLIIDNQENKKQKRRKSTLLVFDASKHLLVVVMIKGKEKQPLLVKPTPTKQEKSTPSQRYPFTTPKNNVVRFPPFHNKKARYVVVCFCFKLITFLHTAQTDRGCDIEDFVENRLLKGELSLEKPDV
jgi:hypothetical protein